MLSDLLPHLDCMITLCRNTISSLWHCMANRTRCNIGHV